MTSMLAGPPGVILFAVATAILAALVVHYRRRWRAATHAAAEARERAEAAEATLAAAPVGCLAFSHADGTIQASPRLVEALGLGTQDTVALKAVLGAFEDAAAARLSAAVERLRADGGGFAMTLRGKAGARVFEVNGARAHAAAGRAGADFVWFRDVTALSRALEEAAAERDSLARLLDALPLPVWRRDADLKLIYCNPAYARAVDEEPGDALTKAIELLGRAKSDAGRDIGRRVLETGGPVSEAHHIVIDGARRLIEVDERPVGDGTLAGHAVDRTDAEELESELNRHVAAHADVLENLGSAIAIFGPDLRLRFFNSAYAHLWGLDEDFLHTEPALGAILEALREARRLPEHANFPEYKREWIRSLHTLIDPVEELLHLPDGSTLRSVTIPHPFGGVLSTYEDVTDRLSLERSYNTLIEVQRETLDNLYEGVAVYGADGRLKLSNPAFARIWNLSDELLASQPHVRQLIEHTRSFFDVPGDEWRQFLEARVVRATEPELRSGRRVRADGTVIDWAQVPLPDGAALFTFLDVTDSIRVERALRERNEALETADRLKSEFIANISYELRTPLNAIVGFAEILENQFFGALNERQLEYSRGIVEASQRLIALINDILDLATIEAGYMDLDLGAVDVREILESIQTLGHERARTQKIELRVECPEHVGTVTADARRLKQALFNLLSNAFKFTPEGGVVTVLARRTETDLQLAVADTGIGIRQEDLDRVFGKFERSVGQGGQSGAGLGLSLVKSLIELHGGWVELDSAPSQGTRVTCHIPLEAGQALPEPGQEPLRA
ncbi:MAG: PAS-domain containing protein [Kiloniellaceae bacterium]